MIFKKISFPIIGFVMIVLTACGQNNTMSTSEGNYSSSTAKSASSYAMSSSLSKEERTARWMENFEIDVKTGDPLYGLTVTSISPPEIHLQGEETIQGTLEWQIFYDIPQLFFMPDITVPEKFQRDFIVENSDILPMRQGAKVKATIDDMTVVFMESNKPSTVLLKTIEVIGEPYESISETSPEWKHFVELNL